MFWLSKDVTETPGLAFVLTVTGHSVMNTQGEKGVDSHAERGRCLLSSNLGHRQGRLLTTQQHRRVEWVGEGADAYLGGEARQAGSTRSWNDPMFCVEAYVQWVCLGVDPEVVEGDDPDGYGEMPESSLGRGCLGRGLRTSLQAHNLPSPLDCGCDLSGVWNQGWPIWRRQVPLQRPTVRAHCR